MQKKPAKPFLLRGLVGESERKTGMYSCIPEDFEGTFNTQDRQQKRFLGIVAVQGGYEAHALALEKLNVDYLYVRSPSDLAQVDGLILPGGESSTSLKLLKQNGLFHKLAECAAQGMPFFGTCAGAILLAKHVRSPAQESLGIVDVSICRNAYGRQLASRIVQGHCQLTQEPMEMVFIRAPRFEALSPQIKIIASYQNEPVCIQQGNHLLTTFHPELTSDLTLHKYFVGLVLDGVVVEV